MAGRVQLGIFTRINWIFAKSLMLCDQLEPEPDDFPGEHVEILLRAAMVCNGNPQTITSLQRGVGWGGDALLMQLHQDLLVQGVQLFIVQSSGLEAKTNNIQTDRREQFQARFTLDQLPKVMGLLNITRDHSPETVQTVFLDRHPHFEGTELPRQLQAIIAEPEIARCQPACFMSQIIRRQRERPAVRIAIPYQNAARFKG